MRFSLPALLVFVLLGSEVQAESQGIIVRQATVYTDASIAGGSVGNVPAGVSVTMFKRKGEWQEIYSEERAIIGWVRSYQVRAGEFNTEVVSLEQEDDRGFLSGLASFSRKASGFFTQDSSATSSGTATIGVRSLSEVEINSAEPDFEELKKMDQYASDDKRVERFTTVGGLRTQKLPYIPEVKMNTHPPTAEGLDTLARKMDDKLDSYAPGVDNAGRFRKVVAVP
jgi:hypothetical protein